MLRFLVACALIVALLGSPSISVATTWHVPSQCSTIQAGIDSASAGDTVLVAPGSYGGDGNRDVSFGGKDIVVASQGGSDITVIDCGGSVPGITHRAFRFDTGQTSASLLQGFTIESGFARYGGAVYCFQTSPSIRACTFVGNRAFDNGGAVFCDRANITISECKFLDNTADDTGGAVFCDRSHVPMTDCRFESNIAADGGGAVYSHSSSINIVDCRFLGNRSPLGGALFCAWGPCPTVTGCTFTGNGARDYGGILSCYHCGPVLIDCVLSGGSAFEGGAIHCFDSSPDLRDCVLLLNEAIADGGAVVLLGQSYPKFTNCTFYGNSAIRGAGICSRFLSAPVLANSIIAFSTKGDAVFDESYYSPTLSCCNLYGNAGGDWVGNIADQYGMNGNFSACPLFCDPENEDFRLQVCSPCAPGNHPDGYDCGLIGAFDVGCECGLPSSVERTSWSALKALYR